MYVLHVLSPILTPTQYILLSKELKISIWIDRKLHYATISHWGGEQKTTSDGFKQRTSMVTVKYLTVKK